MFKNYLAVALSSLLLLSACGGGADSDETAETRTVVHALGETQIPVDPQRIVVIDEYAAMTLLAVGIEPALIYKTFNAEVSPVVFDHLGVETREEPSFLMEPDYEQVRTDEPDLIVMSAAGPLAGNVADFERIAPTIALSFDAGWRESLNQTAAIFDVEQEAALIETALDDRLTELASSWPGNPTLSVLLDYEGTSFHPTPGAPMSQLLAEAGLSRVSAQESTEGEIENEYIAPISPEALDEHDADWIAVLAYGAYNADGVRANPLFDSLAASDAGQDFDVDGEMWFGSSTFAMWWILDDLEAVVAGGGVAATLEQAAERWDSYAANVLDQ